MKEIKAYIRPERADTVISHLEAIGISGMTVIDVSLLGSWADKKELNISIEYCDRYSKACKIELICSDDLAEIVIGSILDHAHSGQPGDGKIFVTNVEDAVSIRTKMHGIDALA